jgi:hypothetical protein
LGDDLTNVYNVIFNITAGIGYTLEGAKSAYGSSYLNGIKNLQSLYDALRDGKI